MNQTTKEPKTKEYVQLQAIISEIMDAQTYPHWDFINNVLSCEAILGDTQIWFSWGRLLIVTKEDRDQGRKAGEMQLLEDWNTEEDGSITLIGKVQE